MVATSCPILLVDDEPANLLALEAVLQELGEPLVRAGSGDEALRRLRDEDFAAVLLDVRMPGMDGFETARLIRSQRRSRATPIIFITADSSESVIQQAYAIGAVDLLGKPLVPAVLKAKVGFFVELHRSRRELQAAELIHESRERLRATEERLRLATDAAGLGVWVWDMGLDRLMCENERMAALLGLSAQDEPVSANGFAGEFLSPDHAPAFRQAIARLTRTGERLHFEGSFTPRGGNAPRWIELTGILQPESDGSPGRILGTAADITHRKRAEDELRTSEERYRTLFESMDQGCCIVEMLFDSARRPIDYRFLEVNPAFERHTGLAGVAGKRVLELVPSLDASWIETLGRVAATGEPIRFENEAKAMGRWFDVYAARLGGPGSSKVAILFSDFTERRRSQENLQRLAAELAETDRRKTEFLATLAHELRNPLAPLSNGLQLIRMASDNPQAQEKARQMMERQLKHLVRLVDDLLDIARISSGKVDLKKECVELKGVLNNSVESSLPLVSAGRHTLSIQIADEGLVLDADPIRLGQVLSNLLNNAAKYTPSGGRIELSVRRDGNQAVIAVTDTGVGIAPEALPEVFEIFTQVGRGDRSQGGLGIGLALVRRLVELHGGSVTAESAGIGRGSRFSVRLPLAVPAVADAVMAAVASEPQHVPRFRVLVVDDNVDAAESLAALLDLAGHSTRIAHDGDQALFAAHEFRPEVVFLDIGMPGKDGYEVARALRGKPETQQAVLVALTGWGAKDDRIRSTRAGFDHHLTKPTGLAAIQTLLSKMVDVRPANLQ